MTDLTARETHFEFGENWADFSRSIDDRQIDAAMAGVRKLVPDLAGKTFLDIGCGSGLSSLAALKLGASRVLATDIDENSVATATKLLSSEDGRWSARKVSVFDLSPAEIGTFDVVYSWGVLHHTGDMKRAIRTAASLVTPGGCLALAIYRKTPLCGAWKIEKRLYTSTPGFVQAVIRGAFKAAYVSALLAQGRNPFSYIRNYRSNRGMNWHHDIHDWLGGYPYESIEPSAFVRFLSEIGFESKIAADAKPAIGGLFGTGCTEYICERRQ